MNPYYQYGQNPMNMSLDESMRVYEDLIQENLHLKQQIQRSKTQKYYSSPVIIQQPTTTCKVQSQQIPFSSQSTYYTSPLVPHQNEYQYYQKRIEYDVKQENEHYLSQLIEKNKYLEDKIDRLRAIYSKQSNDIEQIRRSRQWESRFDCKEDNCYEEKYMQLLRIRSPFY